MTLGTESVFQSWQVNIFLLVTLGPKRASLNYLTLLGKRGQRHTRPELRSVTGWMAPCWADIAGDGSVGLPASPGLGGNMMLHFDSPDVSFGGRVTHILSMGGIEG